jgi:DNA-3-methyladenine glycosylase II
MARYRLGAGNIRKSLDALAQRDRDVRRALEIVGYPEPRRRPEGFETLLRVIVGQQLSVSAAAAIQGRLEKAMKNELSAQRLLRLRETTLRKVGFSRPKIRYARCLARALQSGELDLQELHELSDELAIERIRSVPGLGRWSAQIYLMFSLGRPDIWPEGDVGAMRGLQKLKGFEEKLTSAQAGALVEPLAPHRSAVALLAWKYANSTAL